LQKRKTVDEDEDEDDDGMLVDEVVAQVKSFELVISFTKVLNRKHLKARRGQLARPVIRAKR
jgi:hypothetical protein